MGKPRKRADLDAFKEDLTAFVEFFRENDNKRALLEGSEEEVLSLLRECPTGVALVLDVGLANDAAIEELADRAGIPDIAEEALELIRQAKGRSELINQCLRRAGKSAPRAKGFTIELSLKPVFDVSNGEILADCVLHFPDGGVRELVDSPLRWLKLFPLLGEALRDGWEKMKELGWSLPNGQAREYAAVLKQCAETIQELSSLLPEDVVKKPLEDTTE